jgi:hypothetical protein
VSRDDFSVSRDDFGVSHETNPLPVVRLKKFSLQKCPDVYRGPFNRPRGSPTARKNSSPPFHFSDPSITSRFKLCELIRYLNIILNVGTGVRHTTLHKKVHGMWGEPIPEQTVFK